MMHRRVLIPAAFMLAAGSGCSALLDSGPMPVDGDGSQDADGRDFEADDAAAHDPDGLDVQDLPDEQPAEAQDLDVAEDAPDAVDAEPDGPCAVRESCDNFIDDDGDGSINEGCSLALKFTDGSPPPDTWIDVIFAANRSYNCVHLIVTPPTGTSFVVDESIRGVFFGSYYKWDFTVQLPDVTGQYQIDVLRKECPDDCSCSESFSIMTGTLRVDGTLDDCGGTDDDGDGRVDENCVNSIRFTDLNAWPGDIIDVVATNETPLVCIHLMEDDPCENPRDLLDSIDTGERPVPYTVWDYTVRLPLHGGEYNYRFLHRTCPPICSCEDYLASGATYAVCGAPGC